MTNPVKELISNKGKYEIAPIVAEFVSDKSLEILEHFGYEAPKLLNDYSNALEDALINQVEIIKQLRAEIDELKSQSSN